MDLSLPTNLRNRPEHVGKQGEAVKTAIQTECGDRVTTLEIMAEDSMMTMDYRTDRVRIMVGKDGVVTQAPMIG